jgi:SWI/SNF-related matrix-associated actin-dependent regulator of chromatin subfamily A member 5
MNELKRWCPALRVLKMHSSDGAERERLVKLVVGDVGGYDVVVTTYDMCKAPGLHGALVQKIFWRLVVLDEGHLIKNSETAISQTVRKMHFVSALLLTGTPLQVQPSA